MFATEMWIVTGWWIHPNQRRRNNHEDQKTLCCLFAILFVVGALGVNAMAVSVPYPIMIIDNDPVSSTGYSYSQSGFVYFTDGSLYNETLVKQG